MKSGIMAMMGGKSSPMGGGGDGPTDMQAAADGGTASPEFNLAEEEGDEEQSPLFDQASQLLDGIAMDDAKLQKVIDLLQPKENPAPGGMPGGM